MMDEQLKDPVRRVIELLAAAQYAKLEEITNGVRLKAPEIARVVADYGRKLIPVPEGGLALMDVVRVHGAFPPKWTIRIPLWTQEEGRSDLSVELTLIKDGQDFKIELDDIHVLQCGIDDDDRMHIEQNFEIISYVGAKPLLFGMTRAQAEGMVGPPERIAHDLDEIDAMYRSFRIHYSKQDQKLVEVGFSPTATVTIGGINVFGQKNAFRDLVRQDSCPYESYGFIILLDLGITLTGFHDNDPNQLAITAFARGHWDGEKSGFKKFRIS